MTPAGKKTFVVANAATALTCLLFTTHVQAGRPFATEDAGVLEPKECEWESVASRASTRDAPRETAWNTQIGCGVGLRTQLALAFSRSSVESEHTHSIAVGGKTGLINGGDDGTSVALAYGASSDKGPSDGSYRWNTTAVNLAVSQPLPANWTLHANLGWSRDRPSKLNTTTWALAGEWAATEAWALGAEVYGDDRDKPWIAVGARWDLSPAWSVNASYAVNRENPRTSEAAVGFKLAF